MKFIQKMLAFILVISLVAGCQAPNTTTPQRGKPSGPETAAAATQSPTQAAPPASLADPSQNLNLLNTYQASLQVSFTGTQAGKPSQWSQSYLLGAARNANSRLLTYQETGLDPSAAVYPAFSGYANGVDYYRATSGDACVGNFAKGTQEATDLPEPASLLPKINALIGAGSPETINGISTTLYTVDAASFKNAATAKVDGQVWLATDGRTVVKYRLEISGGKDFFDKDTEGAVSWNYEIKQLNPDVSLLPPDCPLPLPYVPLIEDAKNTIKFPGYTSFETGMDLQAAADFYMNALPGSGFTAEGEAQIGSTTASLAFTKDRQIIDILIESKAVTTVVISSKAAPPKANAGGQPVPASSPTPNLAATSVAGSPQTRVVKALTYLNGENDQPSVFPSYHFEYGSKTPSWDSDRGTAVQKENQLSADVQGKNVHFVSVDKTGGKTKSSEVYLIGDQEYEVTNGTPTPGLGLASLTWVMWPVDVVMVLSISSLKTEPAGSETIDGRATEVYQLSGKISDDVTGMIAALGVPITQSDGKIWVDQETGGLIKMQLDYEMDVKDTSGVVKGQGQGSLEISVTQIGKVSVELK